MKRDIDIWKEEDFSLGLSLSFTNQYESSITEILQEKRAHAPITNALFRKDLRDMKFEEMLKELKPKVNNHNTSMIRVEKWFYNINFYLRAFMTFDVYDEKDLIHAIFGIVC